MKNLIIISIITLTIASSCKNQEKQTNNKKLETNSVLKLTTEQIQNIDLEYTQLKSDFISKSVQLTGKIDVPPQNLISVSVPMGGYLKNTNLLPGTAIKKGEILAILEDQTYIKLQEEYLTIQSKLKLSEKELNRQKELNSSKASSDKIYQTVENEFKILEIQLKSVSEQLKLIGINVQNLNSSNMSSSIKIISPINGYVTKVNVNIGKYVTPSDVIFELVDPKDIHLNLNVFESNIEDLYIGQTLKAYTNTNPEKQHECQVILIGKTFTEQKTIEVHCHFKAFDNQLISGMFMNAILETKPKESYVLKEEAVVNFEGKNYVFIKEKEQFLIQEVEIGILDQGMIEILNHEEFKNKEIVSKGSYTLLMALKNIEEEE